MTEEELKAVREVQRKIRDERDAALVRVRELEAEAAETDVMVGTITHDLWAACMYVDLLVAEIERHGIDVPDDPHKGDRALSPSPAEPTS